MGWLLLLLDVASRPRGSFHLKTKLLLRQQAFLGPATAAFGFLWLMGSMLPLVAAALLMVPSVVELRLLAVVEAWLATTARVRVQHVHLVLVEPRLLAKNLQIEPTLLVGAVAAPSAVEPHSLENQALVESQDGQLVWCGTLLPAIVQDSQKWREPQTQPKLRTEGDKRPLVAVVAAAMAASVVEPNSLAN